MVGFLAFCFIVAAILAEKTKDVYWSSKSRDRAITDNRISYFDSKGNDRWTKTKEPVYVHSVSNFRMYYSRNTGKLLYDSSLEYLADRNKFLTEKHMKGHYGHIDEYLKGFKYPINKKLFYFDNDNNRPYIILFPDRELFPNYKFGDRVLCYFNNNIVPNSVSIKDNQYLLMENHIESFNIERDSMRLLPEKEAQYYNLNESWAVKE